MTPPHITPPIRAPITLSIIDFSQLIPKSIHLDNIVKVNNIRHITGSKNEKSGKMTPSVYLKTCKFKIRSIS
jgi:hypothetical protein